MKITILTIFPEMFAPLHLSMLGRAEKAGLLDIREVDIRSYSKNKHHNTDDAPYGGGAGMVMLAQPIVDAMRDVQGEHFAGRRIYLSPRGKTLTQQKVEELATLRFLEDAENVLLIGSSGVGKTHIAIALGIEAVRAGREVRFVDCARLIEDLRDAHKRGILKNRLKYYTHSKLLIIDELGYLDIEEGGADLLFQLVSARYERRSTIITTNAGISSWGEVLGDTVKAGAIADRVCHHCTMMKITGRSYRLKDLPVERKEE